MCASIVLLNGFHGTCSASQLGTLQVFVVGTVGYECDNFRSFDSFGSVGQIWQSGADSAAFAVWEFGAWFCTCSLPAGPGVGVSRPVNAVSVLQLRVEC